MATTKGYVLSERGNRALSRLVRGVYKQTSVGQPYEAVSIAKPPATWTVKWCQTEDNGNGAWVVWLPSVDHLLWGNTAIDVRAICDGAAETMPAGWYVIPSDATQGAEQNAVKVSIVLRHASKSTYPMDDPLPAWTKAVEGDPDYDTYSRYIPIAVIKRDDETKVATITQIAVGAIHITQTTYAPKPFEFEAYALTASQASYNIYAGTFLFDGARVSAAGCTITGQGVEQVYLVCSATPSSTTPGEYVWTYRTATSAGIAPSGGKVINVLLYTFRDGHITNDYRWASLPVSSGQTGIQRESAPFGYNARDKAIASGQFYFDGHAVTAYGCSITGTGTEQVYLVCTGTKSGDSYAWSYATSTAMGTAPEDGVVLNIPLYTIVDGVITNDYRGTSLPVCSGTVSGTPIDVSALDQSVVIAPPFAINADGDLVSTGAYKLVVETVDGVVTLSRETLATPPVILRTVALSSISL